MANEYIGLLQFPPEEIIFDDEEIKQVLLFFFPGREASLDSFVMTHKMREFAQGLLVEAVDASYALGFVEAIFKGAYAQPGKAAKAFLRTFALRAYNKWFKHAKPADLANLKIYVRIRDQLRVNFETPFLRIISGSIAKDETAKAFIDYASVFYIDKTILRTC